MVKLPLLCSSLLNMSWGMAFSVKSAKRKFTATEERCFYAIRADMLEQWDTRNQEIWRHRSLASRKRRWKEEAVSGLRCSGETKNTGTCPIRFGGSGIWDTNIWSWVPRDSGSRMTSLTIISSNCKLETRPLLRERQINKPATVWQ
jgi:hypothetical protein